VKGNGDDHTPHYPLTSSTLTPSALTHSFTIIPLTFIFPPNRMNGMSDDNTTPIRQQYLDIKRQYPDSILFFRLGDFYETFDQDAEITARELDIVLTSRGVAKGTRIPMAGIPYHAVENYLARLIEKGYHVAICEQVGDQPAKGSSHVKWCEW
jgi:hypothetical protein